MGLYDRDYMRQRREDPAPDADAGERLEGSLRAGWQRRRKLIIAVGLCLLLLLAAAILNALLAGG